MIRALSPQRPRHWAELDEFSFVLGMRLLLWLYRALGRAPFYFFLYPVVLWYMVTKPTARAASREYLCRLFNWQGAKRAPTLADVGRHFAAFAETLLDKLLLWGGWYDPDRVKVFGNELIARQISARRGGIIICAHFGNLELCRIMSRREPGLKLTVLTHTLHAKKFNRLLARLDPESEFNLLQVTEITPATAAMLAAKVERGEFIAIAGDRIPVAENPRVTFAPFFGTPAPFPIGPYVLASLLKCQTFTLFALRRGATSEIHFELFREVIDLPRRGREQALQALTEEYARRLERFCLAAPMQWFNFYDFWRVPVTL